MKELIFINRKKGSIVEIRRSKLKLWLIELIQLVRNMLHVFGRSNLGDLNIFSCK